MWAKSIAAMIAGCLLSVSLVVSLYFIIPFSIDTRLFLCLLLGFPLWVAIMIWCYGSNNGWQAWKRCSLLFILSVGFNSIFLVG